MKIKKSLVIEAMDNYADLVLDQLMLECCESSGDEIDCPCKDKKTKIIIDDEENELEGIQEEEEEVDEGFMGSLYQAISPSARAAAKAAKNKAILKHAQKVGRQVAAMNR
jgi:hypothetical protein